MLNLTIYHLFPNVPAKLIDKHTKYIVHLLEAKGEEYLIKYLKATAESIEHYILGIDIKLEHAGISIGKDDNG